MRERLAIRIPHYGETEADPTDPGWLLLEQAAWLVEILSERLDDYPFTVVQQFVHMMGAHVRPAQPSVGVVLAQVQIEGTLKLNPRRPSPWRFFTPQDEDMDSVEFVPAESDVDLRQGHFLSLCEFASDELHLVGPDEAITGIDGHVMWRAERRRCKAFQYEKVEYVAVTNNAEGLIKALENAMEMLEERRIGWLKMEIEHRSKETVVLHAEIAPEGAFARVAPGGIWMGGDLEGDWGTLDGSTWTPVVTIRNHPLLPPHLHNQFPLPGYEEGQILLTDVPENFPVAELLERKASPMPEQVIEAIWQTLGNQDARCHSIKPAVTTSFKKWEPSDLEPSWVAAALASGIWSKLTRDQPKSVFHLALIGDSKRKGHVRVAMVHKAADSDKIPRISVYPLKRDGSVDEVALDVREAWRLPVPPLPGDDVMPTVVAYDIEFHAEHGSLLIAASHKPAGAMLNALLVANIPSVNDGRVETITRNVPTQLSMLYEDILTRPVVTQLLEEPIPRSAADVLRKLSLCYFSVDGQDPIVDWEGVQVDPSEGTMTINAPDETGAFRTFRTGADINLEWYRRTDGASGNRKPNEIVLPEQPPSLVPKIDAVTNPLGTFFGADRESPKAAIDRLFGPGGATPVMASDWERLVRGALGSRGRGWFVRAWTYTERTLVSSAFWPFSSFTQEPDAEVNRVAARMAQSGPDTLLVVVGPQNGVLADEDLDWARRTIRRMVQRLNRRVPTMRDAIVTRFWPLTMEVTEETPELYPPVFDLQAMQGNKLSDPYGRLAEDRPKAMLLLNAAVTQVVMIEEEVL